MDFSSYVAPEYACTGMLNEKSDVYSFGILIMEIITGRTPVDYNRPKGEVSLEGYMVFQFLFTPFVLLLTRSVNECFTGEFG